MNRPTPPDDYDDNPALDAAFFARARPAAPGEADRLREALRAILEADAKGRPLGEPLAAARDLLASGR